MLSQRARHLNDAGEMSSRVDRVAVDQQPAVVGRHDLDPELAALAGPQPGVGQWQGGVAQVGGAVGDRAVGATRLHIGLRRGELPGGVLNVAELHAGWVGESLGLVGERIFEDAIRYARHGDVERDTEGDQC